MDASFAVAFHKLVNAYLLCYFSSLYGFPICCCLLLLLFTSFKAVDSLLLCISLELLYLLLLLCLSAVAFSQAYIYALFAVVAVDRNTTITNTAVAIAGRTT